MDVIAQIGDVNDIHDYPYPADPKPNDHQYAMIGEFGGTSDRFR